MSNSAPNRTSKHERGDRKLERDNNNSAGGHRTANIYIDANWEVSSYCAGNGSCVELARLASGEIAIRDGKQGTAGPVLVFTPAEWAAFAAGVRAGEFE